MLASYNKNNKLIGIIWNVISFSGISRLTNSIDAVLPILKLKIANLDMFFINKTEILNCYNIFY